MVGWMGRRRCGTPGGDETVTEPTPPIDTEKADLLVELATLRALASDAWGIIAAAENFKHTLVCEHGQHCPDREGHTLEELRPEPIGPEDWRVAARAWRDRWHATMDARRDRGEAL